MRDGISGDDFRVWRHSSAERTQSCWIDLGGGAALRLPLEYSSSSISGSSQLEPSLDLISRVQANHSGSLKLTHTQDRLWATGRLLVLEEYNRPQRRISLLDLLGSVSQSAVGHGPSVRAMNEVEARGVSRLSFFLSHSRIF